MLRARIAVIAMLVVLSIPASACWMKVDVEAYAKASPVLVLGRIVEVGGVVSPLTFHELAYERKEDVHDFVVIEIERVLRNALSDRVFAVGDSITARIDPLRQGIYVSVDIRYDAGDTGVWLVRLTADGDFTVRSHPSQRQPDEWADRAAALFEDESRESAISTEAWIATHKASH